MDKTAFTLFYLNMDIGGLAIDQMNYDANAGLSPILRSYCRHQLMIFSK